MSERGLIERLRDALSRAIECINFDHYDERYTDPIVAVRNAATDYLRETAQAGTVVPVKLPCRRPCTCGHEAWQHDFRADQWDDPCAVAGCGCADFQEVEQPAPEAVAAPGDTPALTKFDYLLNAMEAAGQADVPAAHGYGDKRLALYAHIRRLEADAERLAAAELAERLATMTQAVGLATTIKGDMVMRADDPIGMMQELAEYVNKLRAERDALAERLALAERQRDHWRRENSETGEQKQELAERLAAVARERDEAEDKADATNRTLESVAAALAQREGEVAQAYRWAADWMRALATDQRRDGALPTIGDWERLADRIERGPTPPDGEG